MAYLTNTQFLQCFDARLVGDLVQDTNTRESPSELASDPNLTYILNQASGWVETACFTGSIYSAADLAALPENSLALLQRLVADIALVLLCQRRGRSYKDKYPLLDESLKLLDQLRLGARVFDLPNQEAAGLASNNVVSLATIQSAQWITSTYQYFPLCRPIPGQI